MKPKPKKEVAVKSVNNEVGNILFNATPDAANEFKEFGHLHQFDGNTYSLYVDSRYDFEEVREFIENYG